QRRVPELRLDQVHGRPPLECEWQTAKGDTLADAKAERAEVVARLHRGERVERTKRTVSEAAQAWLERGRGQRGPWDPVTRERYERVVPPPRAGLRGPAARAARRGEAARPDARPRGGVVAAERADARAEDGAARPHRAPPDSPLRY